MKLIVQLSGRGWAHATISDGFEPLSMDLSYLSDGIGEMAASAAALLKGANETKFSFQDEPGEHVFVLTRGTQDSLRIEVFENRRNFERRLRTPVLTIQCAILDFVGQVFSNLHSLRTEEGDSYKERWGYDFPAEQYEFIRRNI